MMRAIGILGLCGLIMGAMGTTSAFAQQQECYKEAVIAEGEPFLSRSLGAFPSSLFAWRAAARDKAGDGFQNWSAAKDRRIDCEQVTVEGNKRRWVCTRSAVPCRGLLAAGGGTTKPAFPGKMRRGDQGDNVKVLQQLLLNQGYEIEVDGNFGRGTRDAVIDFQKKNKLTADGVVGEKTWEAL